MSNWTRVSGQANQEEFTAGATFAISLLGAAATAGNVVGVGIQWFDSTGVVPTINSAQDENGKPYTQIPAGWAPDTAAVVGNTTILYLIVPSGAGQTVTIGFSKGCTYCCLFIDECHLSSGTATFDNSAVSADGASATTVTTPTVPVSGSDDLLFAICGSEGGISTADAPWSQEGSTNGAGGMAEFLLGATTNTAVAFTQSGNLRYACAGASFKAAMPSRPMFRGR